MFNIETYFVKVCFWEDDPVQLEDQDFEGGANVPSLKQARENFKKIGACDANAVASVRKPTLLEMPPPSNDDQK